MVTNFIFTKKCIYKVVVVKVASKLTETETHSTMICRGSPMSIYVKFVCFVWSMDVFQLICKRLKARGTQLTSPENFFIFCIRVHFEFPHMKMKRKRYLPVLVFEISAFRIIKF